MFLLDTQFADSELDRVDEQSWKRVSSLSMINVTTAWLSQDFFTWWLLRFLPSQWKYIHFHILILISRYEKIISIIFHDIKIDRLNNFKSNLFIWVMKIRSFLKNGDFFFFLWRFLNTMFISYFCKYFQLQWTTYRMHIYCANIIYILFVNAKRINTLIILLVFRLYWKMKISYVFDFLTIIFELKFLHRRTPQFYPIWIIASAATEISLATRNAAKTEKRAARDMSIARFCRCSSGHGARLLTSGYTEILLLSRRKKSRRNR